MAKIVQFPKKSTNEQLDELTKIIDEALTQIESGKKKADRKPGSLSSLVNELFELQKKKEESK